MSYKVEIIDEYSFGQWFSHHLRFATETEARWKELGVLNKDGQPFYPPSPPPTPEEIREEAKRLTAAWQKTVDRMDASLTPNQEGPTIRFPVR